VQEQRIDPAERLRLRRERARRARRRRRLLVAAFALAVAAVGAAVSLSGARTKSGNVARVAAKPVVRRPTVARPRALPAEVRGLHVTMSLASLEGRLEGYLTVPGLNTVELDVKDESGRVGFVGAAPPLARATGAAGRYYDPLEAVRLARRHGVYLIGRVVAFEDPVIAEKRPELAIRTAGGGVWHNRAGLAWANPYSTAYWRYLLAVASAAARAGFDEIQLDYVRFPTDGDLSAARFPGRTREPLARTMARFVRFMVAGLHPLHVRVSADVFGLSATRDLGIGQKPRVLARYLDAVYPMVYPSHYNAGEYGIADPAAEPGRTVAASLLDFRWKLHGRKAKVIPWLQDFSLGRTYSVADVREQVAAARRAHTAGFMLWNAGGLYTYEALGGETQVGTRPPG
jgi:hypothetical protein